MMLNVKGVVNIWPIFFVYLFIIEKYYDFLGCKNVKSKYFDRFSTVIQIRRASEAFLILNIIEHGIGKIAGCPKTYE